MYLCMHACMHACMYVHIYVNKYVYILMYINIYVHIYTHMCVYIYIRIYVYMYKHMIRIDPCQVGTRATSAWSRRASKRTTTEEVSRGLGVRRTRACIGLLKRLGRCLGISFKLAY